MQYEVSAMLWCLAARHRWTVRAFTATPSAPFAEHVLTMRATGLLLSRHGPLLASAVLLPPGATVYELLPYNWEWAGISQLYRNATAGVRSVHHFAWRGGSSACAAYDSPDDAKFSTWTADECRSQCARRGSMRLRRAR
jgi:hypothetical protein